MIMLPCAAFLGPAISMEKVYLFHVVSIIAVIPFFLMLRDSEKSELLNRNTALWLIAPLWFLTSFIWAEKTSQALRFELQLLTGLFCLFSLQTFIKSLDDFNKVLKALGVLFVIHLAISLLEAYTSFRLPVSPISPLVKSIRSDQWVQNLNYPSFYENYPTSFFWHPNNLALVTVCSLPLIFSSKIHYLIKMLAWLTSLIVIIKAGAKAMLVLFSVYSLAMLYKCISTSGRIRKAFLPIALVFAIVGTLFWTSLEKEQKHEMKQSFVTFSRYAAILPKFVANQFFNQDYKLEFHGNTRERFMFMEAAIAEYKESPLLGIGAGQLYSKKVSLHGREVNLTSIHNYWLEMFVIGGPFFFLGYITWFVRISIKLISSKDVRDRSFGESMILFFFAAPVMSSVFYFLPKWLLYGLAIKKLELSKEKESAF